MSLELVLDAMLALSLVRHADFHSKAVTLKRPEDILEHSAVQRQRITKSNRSSRRVIGPIAARSPTICYSQATNLIPALLAEYLLSTIRISAYDHKLDNCRELTHDNHKSMSLVHHSWTDIAQRYFRRSTILSSQTSLQSIVQTPMIGPWVLELNVICNDDLDESESQILTMKETSRLLIGFVHRCPNLAHLDLTTYEIQRPNEGEPHKS